MTDYDQELAAEHARYDRAHARGFYRAVLLHRAFAVPMVFAKDGKVVEVSAEEIAIPPEFDPRLFDLSAAA